MTNFFISIYRYFSSHRAVFWTVTVGLFVFCGYFATRINLEEDFNKLMPVSHNEDGSTKLAFANLRIKDKTFLLFEGRNGASPERISSVCDAFIDSLMAKDAERDSAGRVIGDVFYRLDDELMPDLIDYLSAHLPAYIDTSAYARIDTMLTTEHMKRQMQANKKDLGGDFGSMYPELIQMDPAGIRNILADQIKPLTSGAAGSFKTVEGHFFVPDTTVCVAFITPRYTATDTGRGSTLFEMLNRQIETFAKTAPDVHISYHGTPANGYYNASQIKSDIVRTIGGSLVLVLVFIMVCFRDKDTLLLLFLPILFGTLSGLAAMYFIKGSFSLLALGIGAVVLGVAMSYALHVITHYKYISNPEQVLRDQVKPVLLGCLTTIGSFTGILFIRNELLQDFGLFASLAIVGTTVFSLIVLPQLFRPRKAARPNRLFDAISRLNTCPVDRSRPLLVIIGVIVTFCVVYYFIHGTVFDADMHNLGYKNERVNYSESLLRAKTYTGDKQKYFASSGRSMEQALENFSTLSHKLDSLEQAGLVKSYTRTDEILVPLRVQKERIEAWKHFWTEERLLKMRRLINETAHGAGLNAEAFDLFFDAVTADYEPDALYNAGIIPHGYLSTLTEQSRGGDYLCYTSVRCANDTVHSSQSDYYRICDAVAKCPSLLVLDTYYYTTDTLVGINNDFNVLQWVSMLFVFVVLLVSFHFDVRNTLLGFLPILLSWLIALGVMGLCDMRFNLINIIISTFIFGIGVDYSIFVMSGLTGGDGNNKLLDYHKTAIFFSALILIVTVSSMLMARHPAIRSVGVPTLAGLLSAVVISYVVQPAVYRLIHRGKKQKNVEYEA